MRCPDCRGCSFDIPLEEPLEALCLDCGCRAEIQKWEETPGPATQEMLVWVKAQIDNLDSDVPINPILQRFYDEWKLRF